MTTPAETMAAIVKAIHPRLKDAGFRKRRHSFNRSVESGVVQVISFQMGQKLPPGAQPIPRLRPDLYGLFTVNFGVAVEEAWLLRRRRHEVPFPDFVNDYDCDIRERLGQLLGQETDTWWELSPDDRELAHQIGNALLEQGAGWLDPRGTRAGILRTWTEGGLAALPMPTALPIVMILRHLDRHAEAEQALRSYYGGITLAPHKRYVHEVANDLGIDLPSPA
ncbi:MAG: DUF4304 domain-containing protein [Acidimicrobiia bacterium]|nr:DUF4304 domain-containing protein [Acidimicrobiia bacterium]